MEQESEYIPPWREHDPDEKIEGELFWVKCAHCGCSKYVDMREGAGGRREFTREEIIQKYWKEHDNEGIKGPVNDAPCTAGSDSFCIEKADDKKKFFEKNKKLSN